MVESAGATLEDWSTGGRRRHRTALAARREVHDVVLPTIASPITSGVCLPGARGFDSTALTRLLLDHALDRWR